MHWVLLSVQHVVFVFSVAQGTGGFETARTTRAAKMAILKVVGKAGGGRKEKDDAFIVRSYCCCGFQVHDDTHVGDSVVVARIPGIFW